MTSASWCWPHALRGDSRKLFTHPVAFRIQGFDAVVAVYVAHTLAHQVSASALQPEPINVELLGSLGVADPYPAWQEAAHQLVSRAAAEVSRAGG